MKKINYFSLLLCAVFTLSGMFTSCTDPNSNNNVTDPYEEPQGDPVSTLMTADESKKYLTETGKELLNAFNTADQKDAIELIEGVAWKMDNYDWDYEAFADYGNKEIEDMFSITKSIIKVATGQQSSTTSKIFTFNFSRQAVAFEANETTHKWVNKGKTDDNSVILRMKSNRNSPLEAKCWGEGETRSYSYTYYVGEEAQERYTYVGFNYVGYSNYYWNEETYEYVYDYNGDYKYDYQAGGYVYVGPNKGDYVSGISYVYVGKNHGSYNRNNNGWSNNYDDMYDWVGANKGDYIRLTAADASYREVWNEFPPYEYTYVYDQNGNYAKYTYFRTNIEEEPFDGSEARTITVELPEKVHFTLKEGDQVIISFTQTFDMVENDHYIVSSENTIANLTWAQSMNVTYESATASVAFKYGDKTLISATVNVPSYEMAKKQSGDTYGEYGERIADRWESLLNSVGQITTKVNLNNRVQVVARVSNMGDLYNAYLDWEDDFGSRNHMSYAAAKALRNIYNSYCLAGLYYNSEVLQAQMAFDIFASGSESGDYEMEPVIYFPSDDTSYSYGQYFSERRFGSIIDLTEDVANNYLKLLKLFDIDPVDLH